MAEAPHRGFDNGTVAELPLSLKTCGWPKKSEDTTRHRGRPCRRHRIVGDRLSRRSASQRPQKVFDAKLAVQDNMLLVAVDADAVVGTTMAGYDGLRGWLHKVAVLPQHRRRGLATALVRHAIRVLQSSGCTEVNLQIRTTNLEVRGFYEALGFEIEERLSMARHIAPRA